MRPKHYTWPAFYKHVIDLTQHSFAPRALVRRTIATRAFIPRWLNLVRAVSSEGYGRYRYYTQIHQHLLTDKSFRSYFERETEALPPFYENRIKHDLGFLWESLPQGGVYHDAYAYLKSQEGEGGFASVTAQAV